MRRRMFFRGFTLVELIGVVVILGLIALVALPPILNSVRKTKGNISDASQKILYSATEVYVLKILIHIRELMEMYIVLQSAV